MEGIFASIKVQHYAAGNTAPLKDDLTRLARTPETAIERVRADSRVVGLLVGSKPVSKVHYLDGRLVAGSFSREAFHYAKPGADCRPVKFPGMVDE